MISTLGYDDLVVRTPVHRVAGPGGTVHLKDETVQTTGAFKFRGSVNYLLRNPDRELVTASTGNHGLGLSTAGTAMGRSVRVMVPKDTPEIKLDKLERAGAELVICGEDYDESRLAALQDAARTGRRYVPSFDDPDIIAGHQRLFDEARAQLGTPVRRVYVPIGGGGLYAAAAAAMSAPDCEVVGVELAAVPAMHASLQAGRRVEVPVPAGGQAEGLAVAQVGELSFAAAQRFRARVLLVDAAALSGAMRWVWEHTRVRVEGAGAAAVAGMLADADADADRPDGDVLCVLSGGNIDEMRWQSVVHGDRDLFLGETTTATSSNREHP